MKYILVFNGKLKTNFYGPFDSLDDAWNHAIYFDRSVGTFSVRELYPPKEQQWRESKVGD